MAPATVIMSPKRCCRESLSQLEQSTARIVRIDLNGVVLQHPRIHLGHAIGITGKTHFIARQFREIT